MNMRLIFPLVVALALVPMLATHGFRPNPGVGSGYTSAWHLGEQGDDASADSVRFECIAAGADLLRRAAPAINGTARSPWAQRSIGLLPGEQLVCVNR